MHCPSCGNESSVDQNFCRKCGFNLEPVGKLLIGDAEVKVDKAERDRRLMRRMVSWMMRGMVILLIGVVFIVISKTVVSAPLVKLLGSLLTLSGISITMYGVLDTLRGGPRRESTMIAKVAPDSPANLPSTNTTRELEDHAPVALPSVTEGTTELIGNKSRLQQE